MAAIINESLTESQFDSILDTFAQLPNGGKLCFRDNEVSIEYSNGIIRTSSKWLGYVILSKWDRNIDNLTPLIQKIKVYVENLPEEQIKREMVEKLEQAVIGLHSLSKLYSDGQHQRTVLQTAVADLGCRFLTPLKEKLGLFSARSDQ